MSALSQPIHPFTIHANSYLRYDCQAFYSVDYLGYRKPGNPDYINILKNTYDTYPQNILNNATGKLEAVLLAALPAIFEALSLSPLTVCVVPRAKAEHIYSRNQKLFKLTVRNVAHKLNIQMPGAFIDGTDYIIRHTNTYTTHLPPNTPNYNNDGPKPYVGITRDTCKISEQVVDKDILLVDDVYTRNVNIDEDAIQALTDKGARSVTFYAVARTR